MIRKKHRNLPGGGAISEPIEKKLGDHTLRIENMVYDQNGAAIYFTLERPGGVTMLAGNEETNAGKGAYFTQDRTYGFSFNTTSDIFAGYNIYIDTQKSTSDKMYCTAYMLWSESLPEEGVVPQLCIQKYPYSIKERDDKVIAFNTGEAGDEMLEELEEFDKQTETEEIALTDQKPITVKSIDMGNGGCVAYSPISIGIDMSKGFGLTTDEAYDPVNLTHLEIKYKDGSSYVVSDSADNIENNGYVLGGVGDPQTWMEFAFNRIVDVNEIQEIIVNDVTIPVK